MQNGNSEHTSRTTKIRSQKEVVEKRNMASRQEAVVKNIHAKNINSAHDHLRTKWVF